MVAAGSHEFRVYQGVNDEGGTPQSELMVRPGLVLSVIT